MQVLMLCEGNPETSASWSGISHSLLEELRARHCIVHTADVDLRHFGRAIAAASTFSPDRRRWGSKYRLSALPFTLRSGNAQRAITAHRDVDVILQIGATFEPRDRRRTPYVLYCDSNIRMAQRGVASGYSQAVWLTPKELQKVIDRETAVYDNAAAVFTISDELRQSFVDDFTIPAAKVITVHAGPNFDTADLALSADCADRRKGNTILFVGAQFERKGGDLLLTAFRQVRASLPSSRLVIIGPKDLPIDDPGVTCLGYLSKDVPSEAAALRSAFASADVFCLPTRFEPFGIVYLEAMYAALPCVGTHAWAVPEMIDDEVTGFTIPANDVDALADRLLRLLNDSAMARAMGTAGLAKARSHFTWPAVVDRMCNAMHDMQIIPSDATVPRLPRSS